jgi:dienelactone hydrolase
MAELLLFHHAQGLTAGCLAFADELRAGGHVVHAPDLYDGKTFADLADGVGYAEQVGFDTIIDRGRLAADGSAFGGPWPQGVPLQMHLMDADAFALPPNEDLDAARRLDESVEGAQLFVYPGERHLFADNSLPDYDDGASMLLTRRVLSFLDAIA